ncbi:MAG: GIY-YIG nuclease family protein [Gemmataceae bacterium]|nr:GIY-YIG nuclease family protein [Gemmataceae bacterium]
MAVKRKTWLVYIVQCEDGTLYTGITNRLEHRLAMHNLGKGARYTQSRRPVTLVYQQNARNKSFAAKKEARIKSLSRQEKLTLIRKTSLNREPG